MIEKYHVLHNLYERHKALYPQQQKTREQQALAELLDTIGELVRECESIFTDMADAYQSMEPIR